MKRYLISSLFLSLCVIGSAGCSDSETPSEEPPPGMLPDDNPKPPVTMPPSQKPLPTEFMVMRVGTGSGTLQSNVAAAAFIERRTIADGALVAQPLPLPISASGVNRPLTLSGAGGSEGALTRSGDGRYLLFAGYDATPGTTAVIDTAMRVVGRMSQNGSIDTSTVMDGLNGSGNFIRSAASPDGTQLWLSGVLGVAYTTTGSVGVPVARPLGSAANSRVLGFYDGQLYVSRASDSSGGLSAVGMGAPTTDNVAAKQLPGFPSGGNTMSPFGFVAFDRDATPGIDLLYLADDRTDGNGGVQRWRLANGTWLLEATLSAGATSGCRGLAGFVSGNDVILVASTSEIGAAIRLLSFTDNGGPATGVTAKVLTTAVAATTFRGVALPMDVVVP